MQIQKCINWGGILWKVAVFYHPKFSGNRHSSFVLKNLGVVNVIIRSTKFKLNTHLLVSGCIRHPVFKLQIIQCQRNSLLKFVINLNLSCHLHYKNYTVLSFFFFPLCCIYLKSLKRLFHNFVSLTISATIHYSHKDFLTLHPLGDKYVTFLANDITTGIKTYQSSGIFFRSECFRMLGLEERNCDVFFYWPEQRYRTGSNWK